MCIFVTFIINAGIFYPGWDAVKVKAVYGEEMFYLLKGTAFSIQQLNT